MKTIAIFSSRFLCVVFAICAVSGYAAPIVLPAGSALPPGSGVDKGFLVRTVQGPTNEVLANSFTRAVRQLNGTLRDSAGQLVPNVAIPGPRPDGSYVAETISFELDGFPVLNFLFNSTLYPGVPGAELSRDSFAVEAVGFLELEAGDYTFGVAVGADRTDVNDDDGYAVFSDVNPRSIFAPRVGEYQRTVTAPFASNQQNTNYFHVTASVAGLYPFRIVYWQTTRGANLNFFNVIQIPGPLFGTHLLVNEPLSFDSIQAYYTVTGGANANGPYVAEISPPNGASGIASSNSISLLLVDGATALLDSSVRLYLNNALVTPQSAVRAGNKLAVRYDPSATRTITTNLMRVEFADTAGNRKTNTWQFSIVAGTAVRTVVTGQWDFEACDLSATVGRALRYFDGPSGITAAETRFGTCTSLGVALINGEDAKIMESPYASGVFAPYGYIMTHLIPPNGGGTRVNQFTLILDVLVDTTGGGAASL